MSNQLDFIASLLLCPISFLVHNMWMGMHNLLLSQIEQVLSSYNWSLNFFDDCPTETNGLSLSHRNYFD